MHERLQAEIEQRERLAGRSLVLGADVRELEQQLEMTSLTCGQLQVRLHGDTDGHIHTHQHTLIHT